MLEVTALAARLTSAGDQLLIVSLVPESASAFVAAALAGSAPTVAGVCV